MLFQMKLNSCLQVGDSIEWIEDHRPTEVPEEFSDTNWDFLLIRQKGIILEVRKRLMGAIRFLVLTDFGKLSVVSEKKVSYIS